MLAALLPILGTIGEKIAASLFPDPAQQAQRDALKTQLQTAALDHAAAIEQAAAENVKAEIASGSWLAKSWRPITMLIFVALIVARWMGWTAANMTPAEYLEIYGLMKIGLGGYVIGRSAEKVAPAVISAITGKFGGGNDAP